MQVHPHPHDMSETPIVQAGRCGANLQSDLSLDISVAERTCRSCSCDRAERGWCTARAITFSGVTARQSNSGTPWASHCRRKFGPLARTPSREGVPGMPADYFCLCCWSGRQAMRKLGLRGDLGGRAARFHMTAGWRPACFPMFVTSQKSFYSDGLASDLCFCFLRVRDQNRLLDREPKTL